MNFYGLQKMTLLDFPGKVACTLFTGGCNFRCPFCHNALLVTELSQEDRIPEEEILTFLEKRTGLLDGVAVTGGEPLLNPEILSFLRKVRAMNYQIKLDTNGSYPDLLASILQEHLVDYVAIDIKNQKSKYASTIGLPSFDLSPLEKSISILQASGLDYEFRTTVVQEFHTVEDIVQIAQWISGAPHYFLQNFVDSGNLIGENLHAASKETLLKMKEEASHWIPNTQIRGI